MSKMQEPKVVRVTEADLQECEEFRYSLKWKLAREIRELRAGLARHLELLDAIEVKGKKIVGDNARLRELLADAKTHIPDHLIGTRGAIDAALKEHDDE